MKVDLLDLITQYHMLQDEIDRAIKEVLESGHFIMGPNVKKLEEEIAQYSGVKHAIAVANGTDALMLTLRALDIKEGDEVITSPFTFFASAETTSVVGATPVFADIDAKTLNIDPHSIEQKITERTKAIIPVHIFGQMADMDAIMAIAKKHNLYVIEDAAQAIGAQYNGKRAGSIGVAGTYSFFPTKNLGGYGDGGMIVTNDDDMAAKLRLLRAHGSNKKYHHSIIGHNSRLDEIQAAILRVKFKYLDKWSELRKKNAHYYNALLQGLEVIVPYEAAECRHVFHQYVIRVEDRNGLEKYLNGNGIGTAVYYPLAVHLQEVYKDLGYKIGDLPVAERACEMSLALPMFPELTEQQQQYVAEKIKEYLSK
jgi:dTDP-4-amino-4,6-dideoxygalactose transaminase